MYKKVKKYAMENNLTVSEKNDLAYGMMNGFFIVIKQNPGTAASHIVQIWAKAGNTAPVPSIADFVNQCPGKYQYLQTASYNGSKIIAHFQGLGFQWGKKYVPCLDMFLKEITTYCTNNGLIPDCEVCGTSSALALFQIEGEEHMLCTTCQSNTIEQLQRNASSKAKGGNGNIVGGIVGALLGSLLGVAAWVLIYQLGYLSAIAGIVMVICALKGYEILGGKLNKTGIIICCMISVLMVLFAEQISLSIEIYNVYQEYYYITFFDAFQSVPAFLEDSEVLSAVIYDLAIGYLLMIFGAWSTIRQALKNTASGSKVQMITAVTKESVENRM